MLQMKMQIQKVVQIQMKINFDNIKNKNKKLINLIFVLMSILILFCAIKTNNVYADDDDEEGSKYYSNLSDSEIKKIFKLEASDVKHPLKWIMNTQTYVIIEEDEDGNIQYWWNSPNIQTSAINSLYDVLMTSGYGNVSGRTAKSKQGLIKLPNADDAHTALQKYGFSIENATYMGERPLITISILDVLKPDSKTDTVKRAYKLAKKNHTVVEMPTDKDLNTLEYLAPRDYNQSNNGDETFEEWIKTNWYTKVVNLDEGQILRTNMDSEGCDSDGNQWIKANIITDTGLTKTGLTSDEITSKLFEVCDGNIIAYMDLINCITTVSGIPLNNKPERIMPYDLKNMNSEDSKLFNGVIDHRTDMQDNFFNTGNLNRVTNMFKSFIVNISGSIAEKTVVLNSFCSFSFFEKMGIDIMALWRNQVIHLLLIILGICFLGYLISSTIKFIIGNKSATAIILKVVGNFLMCILIVSLTLNVDNTLNLFKKISTPLFNMSNITLEANDKIKSLYGNGNSSEKLDCSLWLPYFNMWTIYNTSSGLLDNSQTIDKNDGTIESQNVTQDTIGDKKQTLWSTVLANCATTKGTYSNNVYRMVDHFLAPRIKMNDATKLDMEVKQNENYKGDLQSNVSLSIIPYQILIILLVFFKVLLFFEFILNIAFLLFNLALSSYEPNRLKLVLKELGASMLNVCIISTVITIVIWTSLVTSGFSSIVILIFYFIVLWSSIKQIANSNSVFTPKFFRPVKRATQKVKSMFN